MISLFRFTMIAWLGLLPLANAFASDVDSKITTPKQFLGFNIGDDYHLANYQQNLAYWQLLDKESDRVKVVEIGRSEEDRPQVMAVVTSAENHKNLEKYREIAGKLARAEGISQEEARKLATEGKAVVWMDGGLHATETLCAQTSIELVYNFAAKNDEETKRILDETIILFVHANPDGMDLIADWYMKPKDPKARRVGGAPVLYQKYAGHDNNRDFYAAVLAETQNMNRIMYREWLPQIVYNPHQPGPSGTIMFAPPFRDPFNYNIDPLIINGIDAVGAAMMQRFIAEGKPGVTNRSGARYSTWWNGGLRSTAYYHNMIGLLTETIGNPTPMQVPMRTDLYLPRADYLYPIAPQKWHFRQSVDYSVTAAMAVFDYAARNREHLLYNIWYIGDQQIQRGNRDTWTVTPKMLEAAKEGMAQNDAPSGTKAYEKFFQDPAKRDPRAFIIPSDQPDFLSAIKFVNTLIGSGVIVHQATEEFTTNGKTYPAGSLILKSSQAFRSMVLDMFEPQDHPNDYAYPGGPPVAPYDMAGWTWAYQMGIQFDRHLEGVDGPFKKLEDELSPTTPTIPSNAAAFLLDGRTNDSFRAVNRLLKEGAKVSRLTEPFDFDGKTYPAGSFIVAADQLPSLKKSAEEFGLSAIALSEKPKGNLTPVKPVRIALWDRYGGSMPSGWTRRVLEWFEFPFDLVFAPELDAGNLREKYDVIIFVDGAISAPSASDIKAAKEAYAAMNAAGGQKKSEPKPSNDPYAHMKGSVTAKSTIPQLQAFLEEGGTILTIGKSTALARYLELPVSNHLAVTADGGKSSTPGRGQYYIPASVLQTQVDTGHPLAWGLNEQADVMFANSPVFRLDDDAKAVKRVAWFPTEQPLRSGWALGQERLKDGVAVADAEVGKGRLVLFGPEILFRAQPHGTFKFLFNGISLAARENGERAQE